MASINDCILLFEYQQIYAQNGDLMAIAIVLNSEAFMISVVLSFKFCSLLFALLAYFAGFEGGLCLTAYFSIRNE